MNRSKYIANRVREVFLDGKWIANTNIKEQVSDLDWTQAIYKVDKLNTIAALSFHLNYYLEGILLYLIEGKFQLSDQYSFDLPEITSEAEWKNLVNRLLSNAELFAHKIESIEETVWEQNFVHEKYGTYLRNIEGLIEHSYYHLGQIVLIRKFVNNEITH